MPEQDAMPPAHVMAVHRPHHEIDTEMQERLDNALGDLDIKAHEDIDDECPELVRSKMNLTRMHVVSQEYAARATDVLGRMMRAQDGNLIERSTIRDVVLVQRQRSLGCLSLPFSLCFFGFFGWSTYLHEDISNVFMIESGIRKALGANLQGVDTIPQLWNWMRYDTLVPELFDQNDLYGVPETNKSFWSRVLVFNQLQGPLVLEQSRSKKAACEYEMVQDLICYDAKGKSEDAFGRNVSVSVATPSHAEYSGGNVTLEQRRAYYASGFTSVSQQKKERRLRPMQGESLMPYMPKGPGSDDDKFKVFIFPNTPRALIEEHFSYLYEKGWIDEQTKEVKVQALLLNAEVGRPRLEEYKVIFSFSRGGGLFARMTLESMFMLYSHGNMTLLCDFFWIMCLLFTTVIEMKALFSALKQRRCRSMFTKFWTFLQWTIIGCGWMGAMGYAYQNTLRAAVVKNLKIVVANQREDVPAEENEMGDEMFAATDAMIFVSSWLRLLLADYHIVLMVRFFTAFHAQPRLGVVTSTLEACVMDIVHFLVVLLPTFMAYAVSGCFIFGRRMHAFATFNSAIGFCFKMAMEGEYDWELLSTEYFWTAAIWTWTFMMLMVMLMLNMVLAIVMDVYTEMRKNAGNSETVYVSLKNLVSSMFHWRRWVNNKKLLKVLPDMEDAVSREDFLTHFPGMAESQLTIITSACHRNMASKQDVDIADSQRMMMAIKLAIDNVNEEVQVLHQVKAKQTEAEINRNYVRDQANPERESWLHKVSRQMAAQNHWMLQVQWMLQQLQWQWKVMDAVHGRDFKWEALHLRNNHVDDEDKKGNI